VMDAACAQPGETFEKNTVAVSVIPPSPAVSMVISFVPCPVVIVPSDTTHLNSGFAMEFIPLILALNRSGAPYSTSVGPLTPTMPHVAGVCALTAEASVSNKNIKRIRIDLPMSERIESPPENVKQIRVHPRKSAAQLVTAFPPFTPSTRRSGQIVRDRKQMSLDSS